MSVDLFGIQWRSANDRHKKAGTKVWSRRELAGCPDKFSVAGVTAGACCRHPEPRLLRRTISLLYAVLLGRIVKSRTWVRMLDICIPFSCETNGRISAMN